MLQHGQPHLVPQHHQEVGPRDPGVQPVLAHRSRRHPVGPLAGRERPHQPGPISRQAHPELPGPEHGGEDPSHRLRGVLVAHAKELERGV